VFCKIGEIDRDKDPLEPLDQGDVDLRRTSDLDDIDTAQRNRQFDTGTIENTGEENDNLIRWSSRRVKQPTPFANKVMVGLQCGRMIHTDPIWDALLPLNPLPKYQGVALEQDMTSSSFLTQPEINRMRELYYLDSFPFDEDWDPETEIEAIMRHRHVRYARRIPGKNTYRSDIAPVTTKGVRLLVKFFSGDRAWVPMKSARSDNPLPIIEYSMKNDLWKHSKLWKWTKLFDVESLEDLRGFLAKYENAPKYIFGVQIPTSIAHALRLDKLNGNNLWQEAIQNEMG
jgi:hypothetical protein